MIVLSDELFNRSSGRSQDRDSRLWVIVIIFMIINVGVLSYFTYFREPDGADVDALNAELDSLRFPGQAPEAALSTTRRAE